MMRGVLWLVYVVLNWFAFVVVDYLLFAGVCCSLCVVCCLLLRGAC